MKIDLQQLMRYIPFVLVYLIAYYDRKKNKIEKLDDLYFNSVLIGLIGARLTYAIFDVGIGSFNWSSIISVSRFNLNFTGGIVIALVVYGLSCKYHKLDFSSYLKYFLRLLLILIVMSAGIELVLINQFAFYMSMTSTVTIVLNMSIFTGIYLLEVFWPNKYRFKYLTECLLLTTLIIRELL